MGVPITRSIVFWGLYWGPPILGNYHIRIPRDLLGCLGISWERMGVHGLGLDRGFGYRVLGFVRVECMWSVELTKFGLGFTLHP